VSVQDVSPAGTIPTCLPSRRIKNRSGVAPPLGLDQDTTAVVAVGDWTRTAVGAAGAGRQGAHITSPMTRATTTRPAATISQTGGLRRLTGGAGGIGGIGCIGQRGNGAVVSYDMQANSSLVAPPGTPARGRAKR
jgi:hypothetical protein